MGFLLPEKEIKQTLANVDATLTDVRQQIPRAAQTLTLANAILDDVRAITAALRAIFVRAPR